MDLMSLKGVSCSLVLFVLFCFVYLTLCVHSTRTHTHKPKKVLISLLFSPQPQDELLMAYMQRWVLRELWYKCLYVSSNHTA